MVGGDDNGVLNAHFLLRGVGWKVWWKRCGGAASSWLRTRKNTEKFFFQLLRNPLFSCYHAREIPTSTKDEK